ncbi:MAG: carbohydrate ABC transporter permease [Treponema sp.]|nr:carbohydrate ABC transporter permease [Treponema sp.]
MKKLPVTQYTLLVLGLFIMVTPMVFMVSSSLRPNAVAFTWPPRIIPQLKEITFANYKYVISRSNFMLYFRNTVFVASITTAVSSLFASMMAFCISRFRFPGRRLLFGTIISVMLIPGLAMLVPQFELAVWFKLINTLWGVILFYTAWALPFSAFLIKGYMDGLPRELDEATVMDGGSVFTIYTHVIMPLASPSIAAVSIFNFLFAFEELAWSQTILKIDSLRTLPVALTSFFQAHNRTDWGYVFALTCLAMIPVVIIYILLQRYFIAGLSTGAVKG